jgi:multicomponent Na+:H+ antiporter subunit G
MIDILASGLVLIGCVFMSVGSIGLVRLPDVYSRMHATSTATTLGTASILSGGFLVFLEDGSGLTLLVTLFFLFLTAPTGSHLVARATMQNQVEK